MKAHELAHLPPPRIPRSSSSSALLSDRAAAIARVLDSPGSRRTRPPNRPRIRVTSASVMGSGLKPCATSSFRSDTTIFSAPGRQSLRRPRRWRGFAASRSFDRLRDVRARGVRLPGHSPASSVAGGSPASGGSPTAHSACSRTPAPCPPTADAMNKPGNGPARVQQRCGGRDASTASSRAGRAR